MGSGMDQYLANSLTTLGVFQVVTDPQKADAIFTERVGESFESKLNELYPPPAPPKPVAAADDKAAKDAKSGAMDLGAGAAPHVSTFSRGKGNFFIVDRKSRTVIWSTYERPSNTSPAELAKVAERVVKRLKNSLTGKKESSE
jgi:hypothetical protein